MLGGDIPRLGEVLGRVVQLPGVLFGVVHAGGEPLHRLGREVPGDPVGLGARPPAVLVDRARAGELEVLHRMTLLGRGIVERAKKARAVHRLLLDPVDVGGLWEPDRLQDRRGDVVQWVNCVRRSPPGLIRSGQATTIGLRVPPRWLEVCLPHWNGVLPA